jgi:hypothetical protein
MRESVLTVTGRGRYTGEELTRLYESREMGPVGFLATAALLDLIGHPARRVFAERGADRLALDHARKDGRLVWESELFARRVLPGLARGLADLEEPELERLSALLFTEDRKQLGVKWLGALRDLKEKPAAEVLPPVLDAIWEEGLRAVVEAELKKLATRTPAARE